MTDIYTTDEFASITGWSKDKLLKLQRDGILSPASDGEGKQRRLSWSGDDLARVQELKRREKTPSLCEAIIDELGGDAFIESYRKAKEMMKNRLGASTAAVFISENRARTCQNEDQIGFAMCTMDRIGIFINVSKNV